MKEFRVFIIIIIAVAFPFIHTFSQVKKSPAKKTTVSPKSKTPVKSTAAVAKTKPAVKKPVVAVKKTTPVVAPVNKTQVTSTLPNKPVNNAEIVNVSLTSREQEMINEINALRANPVRYCAYVDEYLQKYEADEDAKAAAKELVSILKKMKPLAPLSINTSMYKDAKYYGLLMAKRNVFEHSSLPYYENLSLGYKNIRDAIVDLLIDDGIPDRGHRNNLLNDKIKDVAVYELEGKIQNIGYCYVQVFK
jgi:uncharacterized protein YkwD